MKPSRAGKIVRRPEAPRALRSRRARCVSATLLLLCGWASMALVAALAGPDLVRWRFPPSVDDDGGTSKIARLTAEVIDGHFARLQDAARYSGEVTTTPRDGHGLAWLFSSRSENSFFEPIRNALKPLGQGTVGSLYDDSGALLDQLPTGEPLVPGDVAPDELATVLSKMRGDKKGAVIALPKKPGRFLLATRVNWDPPRRLALVAFCGAETLREWISAGAERSSERTSVFDWAGRALATSGPGRSSAPYTSNSAAARRIGTKRPAGKQSQVAPVVQRASAHTRFGELTVLVERTIDPGGRPQLRSFAGAYGAVFVYTLVIGIGTAVMLNIWFWESPRRRQRPPQASMAALDPAGGTSVTIQNDATEGLPAGPDPSPGRRETAPPATAKARALTDSVGGRPGTAEDRECAEPAPLSPRLFVREDGWKVLSASVAGASHSRGGLPCQDAAYGRVLPGGLLVGAVADGAGSATFGDHGARTAVRAAVDALASYSLQLGPVASDAEWHRVLLAAMDIARAQVEASAAARRRASRELAATLIVFVAMPDLIVAVQVGDGAIVLRDEQGALHALTRPQSGEYINTTTFLVTPNALKSSQQVVWHGSYSDIAVFTDGLQMLALTMPNAVPHAGFFGPLFQFAREGKDAEPMLDQLETFLGSDRVGSKTDDDLTLMLAIRTDGGKP
jgi:hypothetical protein